MARTHRMHRADHPKVSGRCVMSDVLCGLVGNSSEKAATRAEPKRLIEKASEYFGTSVLACFARGMRIETDRGMVPVEEIEEENLVRTLDHGLQPVRRVLSKKVEGFGALAPVVFRAGVLGNGRDLVVSPHHRVLLSGWQAELLAGCQDALAMAKDVVNGKTVLRLPMAEVEYFHLLFDRHEVIFAEGAPTESYHPLLGDSDLRAPETQDELLTLFPELHLEAALFGPAVRPTLTAQEAMLFNL